MALSPESRVLMDEAGALFALGRFAEAERLYRRVVAVEPGFAAAFNNLGTVLQATGKRDEAERMLRRALEIRPDYPEACNGLAVVLRGQGRLEEARAACARALALHPSYVDALTNMGNVLGDLGRGQEAVASFLSALNLAPDSAKALRNLGTVLMSLGRYEEAAGYQSRALALDPDDAAALAGLASALVSQGRPEEALDRLGPALARASARPVLLQAMSLARLALGDLDQAIALARRAVRADPGDPQYHFTLGFALLTAGKVQEGAPEYEWRLRQPPTSFQLPPGPPWAGGDLRGRRLIVINSQGFGDWLQFSRYVEVLRPRCRAVALAVAKPLAALFAASFPECECLDQGGFVLEDGDVWVDCASLPWIIGLPTRSEAYLGAPSETRARWRAAPADRTRLRVGLAWSGNVEHRMDRARSLPLALLTPLFELAGVEYHVIQKGVRTSDAALFARLMSEGRLVDHDRELRDFADTAGLCASLDLVISADSAPAHLAAAIGCETWLLLWHIPEWRWSILENGERWYPAMRHFRQTRRGDWDEVIARVRAALAARIAARAPA